MISVLKLCALRGPEASAIARQGLDPIPCCLTVQAEGKSLPITLRTHNSEPSKHSLLHRRLKWTFLIHAALILLNLVQNADM